MGAPTLVSSMPGICSRDSRSAFKGSRAGRQAPVQPAPLFTSNWKLRARLSTSRFCATNRINCFYVFHRVMSFSQKSGPAGMASLVYSAPMTLRESAVSERNLFQPSSLSCRASSSDLASLAGFEDSKTIGFA